MPFAFAPALPLAARGDFAPRRRVCAARRRTSPLVIVSSASTDSAVPDVKEYERYLKDVARVKTPMCLQALLLALVRGGEVGAAPNERSNLHPFLIPLSKNEATGATTGLLRWPTAPETMDLPIARTIPGSLSLSLVAPSAISHVSRVHATADYAGNNTYAAELRALAPAAELTAGAAERSGMPLERYIVLHVGYFPDVYRDLAEFHLAKDDVPSALVTCERANTLFPGWASPHVYHARLLQRLGRAMEARDSARFALQMPLWTMGGAGVVQDMGRLAGYQDDESLRKIYQRLFEDKREKDIAEGKAPEQVALDRAAYYLDWATARGVTQWDDVDLEVLAELYDQAKLPDIATFVRY